MNKLVLSFTLSLLVSFSLAIESDFCVSDPSFPRGPAGYSCKDPSNATTDDFVFTGFRGEKTPDNFFGLNVTFALVDNFPGLNGLGISMARIDYGVGGRIPIHTHRTSEIIVVVEGSLIAGFIDSNNVAYYKTLEVGDVMIFPQALLHFQINNGTIPAKAFVSLNSPNPGFQFPTFAFFVGNLPATIAEQVTLISSEEVARLRDLLSNIF